MHGPECSPIRKLQSHSSTLGVSPDATTWAQRSAANVASTACEALRCGIPDTAT